jgi:hypothetical protein
VAGAQKRHAVVDADIGIVGAFFRGGVKMAERRGGVTALERINAEIVVIERIASAA